MPWVILSLAGLLEVAWAVGLKYTEGFTRPVPSILTGLALAASVWLLAISARSLPIGTAYAVWTGIGAVGTVIVGIVKFGESASAFRLICVGLIVVGLIGLKFAPGSR
ncbi:MAG: quaternary ammonium compound efflux SMR transporter SugE [Acidobacteria bacterium]|jgi:quaternary ammonium compound-resistance protein SugE|nr:quaternary ammonium compound efflux SMR transporter SugE [Acidobacteriota bacterium]